MKVIAISSLLLAMSGITGSPVDVRAALATEQLAADPDDPAIWLNPVDPARSLILGTIKSPAPTGGLVVYDLEGRKVQLIEGIDRPNNVDVEYGLNIGGKRIDIAVLTERLQRRLRVFRIENGAPLTDISGALTMFAGAEGEQGAPMGIGLYRRPKDGVVFAIVGRKTGPSQGYLWQYRLEDNSKGKVKATKVREFGTFSGGTGEIEAIAVDDDLGYVYYADEGNGVHKWHADPDHPQAAVELAHFGRDGFRADREGIAIYALRGGKGYIFCTDQLEGNTEYRVFRREGAPGKPHDHSELVAVIRGGADSTDGIEISSSPLGLRFPKGMLVAMNSTSRNFLIFDWREIVRATSPKLKAR